MGKRVVKNKDAAREVSGDNIWNELLNVCKALVLVVVKDGAGVINYVEMRDQIVALIDPTFHEHLYRHISDAYTMLIDEKKIIVEDSRELPGKTVLKIPARSKLNASKNNRASKQLSTQCDHACQCVCHQRKGVLHITACCRQCETCGKRISCKVHDEHMKSCHNQ